MVVSGSLVFASLKDTQTIQMSSKQAYKLFLPFYDFFSLSA